MIFPSSIQFGNFPARLAMVESIASSSLGTTYVHEFKDFKDALGFTTYEDRWRPLKGSASGI